MNRFSAILLLTALAPAASFAAGLATESPKGLTGALSGSESIQKTDPVSWPGTEPFEFGCYLESQLGAKISDYNCAVVASGKPTSMNRSGPEFPNDKVALVKPNIAEITLTWERMKLQEVALRLTKKLSDTQVKKFLGVKTLVQPRHNVELIKINTCGGKTCILIQNQKRSPAKTLK